MDGMISGLTARERDQNLDFVSILERHGTFSVENEFAIDCEVEELIVARGESGDFAVEDREKLADGPYRSGDIQKLPDSLAKRFCQPYCQAEAHEGLTAGERNESSDRTPAALESTLISSMRHSSRGIPSSVRFEIA